MEYVHRLLRRDPHLLLRLDTKVTGFEDAEVTIEIGDDNSDIKQFPFFVHRCSDIEQMTRLGESIGISKLIHECCIQIKVSSGTMDPNNFLRSLDNAPSYQRLQSIYRGIESNTSIKTLTLDLESIGIPRNESFSLLNFQNAQFISNLNDFRILNINSVTLNDDDSTVIAQALAGMLSLVSLNIRYLATRASAFRTIISACPSSVEWLYISCDTAEHCSILASFLQSNHLMVSHLNVTKKDSIVVEEDSLDSFQLSEQEASMIIDGLKNGNTCLETLYIFCCKGDTFFTSAQTLLCDTTSIESICLSNHTLIELQPFLESEVRFDVFSEQEVKFGIIVDSLRLNRNSNKNRVIREKISRYYFVGNFDVSPFVKLPVSVVPSVLGMIKGKKLDRQSAIFRLLKSIPDLCNVVSRVNINVGNDDDIDVVNDASFDSRKRQKSI